MFRKLFIAIALTAATLTAAADATNDFIQQLHSRYPATIGSTVAPAFPGFYSIVTGNEVLFMRSDFSVLLHGDVVDLKTGQSLSAKILTVKADSSMFNPSDAIHLRPGTQRVVVFADPDCPYCRKLQPELLKLKNVEVDIYELPLTSLHPNASRMAQDIWCSTNPAKSWDDYVSKNILPTDKTCLNPLARNLALSEKLHISGTPALVFPDGTIHAGYLPAYQIQAQLDALTKVAQKQ